MLSTLSRPLVRPVWPWRAALLALVATACLWIGLERHAASARTRVGLVFHADACDLWPGMAAQAGGQLTVDECGVIAARVRGEVDDAFAGLRIDITDDARAFWTVHVVARVPARTRMTGAVGASVAMGPLGGRGLVGLQPLTVHALRYAPPGTSRDALVTAIGRGVGRAVVHELAHQVVGGSVDGDDPDTYEYGSAERASQFYGTLRWGPAGERMRERLR
ncbi:MAG TPA: hypothetical protein VMF13_03995 [Luteitalea sp.]|nr:hypothetical protein [Luteitalea sp.]